MVQANRQSNLNNTKVLTLLFLAMCLLGSIPYLACGYVTKPTEALFLSVSAFTTTGAGLGAGLTGGLLIYHVACQWIGGLSILIFLTSMLPSSAAGSIIDLERLSSGKKLSQYFRDKTTHMLIAFYVTISILMFTTMALCGHSAVNALLLTFTTCSTGGLGSASLAFTNAELAGDELFCCGFMILSSISFTLYARLINEEFSLIRRSSELKAYACIILAASAMIMISNGLYFKGEKSLWDLLSESVFQVVSFNSTTGLTNTSLASWPGFSKHVLWLLSFCGACSVSTGSGIKLIRMVLIFKLIKRSFFKRFHPRAVIALRMDGKPVSDDVCFKASGFIMLYVLIFIAGVFALSFSSPDMETAFYGAGSLLNNVGTSFGVIGEEAAYDFLDTFGRLFSCVLMLAGRLEMYALILPFVKKQSKGSYSKPID